MTDDYEYARDQMGAKAQRIIGQVGNERAVQHFLGWIDALTAAIFAINGVGFAGAVRIDSTKTNQDGGLAA